MKVLEWEDPFNAIDALIQTTEEAEYWLQFWTALRGVALLPRSAWATDDQLRQAGEDDDALDLIHLVRAAAEARDWSRAWFLGAIDLWAVRTRLEWGLG